MKKWNKGFTLAELLIVVAIIGVLVAISIPLYSKLVQKARLAANQANARAAYSAVEIQFLTSNHRSEGETYYTYDTETGQIGMQTAIQTGRFCEAKRTRSGASGHINLMI